VKSNRTSLPCVVWTTHDGRAKTRGVTSSSFDVRCLDDKDARGLAESFHFS